MEYTYEEIRAKEQQIACLESQMELAQLHDDDRHFFKVAKEHTQACNEYAAMFAE